MKFRNLFLGLAASAAALAAFAASPASATPDNYAFGFSSYDGVEALTINGTSIATNGVQGWVSPAPYGGSNEGGPDVNTNYIVGTCCFGSGGVYANYFVFSLAGATGPVTSASLTISPFSITQAFTYVLHDATPYVGSLNDATSPNPTLYSELGNGTVLGSFSVTPDESYGAPLVFNLNSTGLALLNSDITAGDSQFAISGTVFGQAGATGGVPEPATWAMMLVGFGGLGAAIRRRRKMVALAA